LGEVEKIDNSFLVVKFRPTNTLSLDVLKSLLGSSEKLRIDVSTPFVEALNLADVLISYSSTTIEEAIYNNKPVVIYGGQQRGMFFPLSGDNSSSILYAGERSELEEKLQRSLNSKTTEEDMSFYLLRDRELRSFKEIDLLIKEDV
jgi:CDP-glycerol glycerophosphotransferase (TagB/SpsB family)